MADLWRASGPGATPDNWRAQPGTSLLGWWWAAFLMGSFIGQQAAKLGFSSDTSLDGLKAMTATSMAGEAIWALGGILAVILVWQIRSRLGAKTLSQGDDVADRRQLDASPISPETA
jgi:hypothetical protein